MINIITIMAIIVTNTLTGLDCCSFQAFAFNPHFVPTLPAQSNPLPTKSNGGTFKMVKKKIRNPSNPYPS